MIRKASPMIFYTSAQLAYLECWAESEIVNTIKLALHFSCLPADPDPDHINDNLYLVHQKPFIVSDSCCMFIVYGLHFAFRMMLSVGLQELWSKGKKEWSFRIDKKE